MLSPTYPLNEHDCAGIFVRTLAVNLVQQGVEVTVLTSSDYEGPPSGIDEGVHVIRVRYCLRALERLFYRPSGGIPQRFRDRSPVLLLLPFFCLSYVWSTLIRVRRYDVVHCHWFPTALLAVLPSWIGRRPLVVTLRGSGVNMMGRTRFGKILQRILLWRKAKIISVNNAFATANSGLLEAFRNRVCPIPNGITSLPPPAAADRRRSNLQRLLFIGNHVRAKGIYDLMEAFDTVSETYIDLTLTLIGDLNEREEVVVKWVASKNGQLDLWGMVPHQEVLKALREHDLLVFPSHREGRPNVVMEAAANGLPILASALPGITEVFQDREHAVLYPSADVPALTTSLRWCLENPDALAEYASAAKRRVEELELDWPSCAARHIVCYESCVAT